MRGRRANILPLHHLRELGRGEIHRTEIISRLEGWQRRGWNRVALAIPWGLLEKDIHHVLERWMSGALERGIHLVVIATPEVALPQPGLGLPVGLKPALTSAPSKSPQLNDAVIQLLPPQPVTLPCPFHPDYQKRHSNWMSRLQSWLKDLDKVDALPGKKLGEIEVWVTGSFYPYIRSGRPESGGVFAAQAGSRSQDAELEFRRAMEAVLSTAEFQSSRWKARTHEGLEWSWFSQTSEETYRFRSERSLRKKPLRAQVTIRQVELRTPEADPIFQDALALQSFLGGDLEVPEFSTWLDEWQTRIPGRSDSDWPVVTRWTELGGLENLPEASLQFLILQSLVGSVKGGILLDEGLLNQLSQGFLDRLSTLADRLDRDGAHIEPKIGFLQSQLSVEPHDQSIWAEMRRQFGAECGVFTHVETFERMREAKLLWVDRSVLLTRDVLYRLLKGMKSSGSEAIVVLARDCVYSDHAQEELSFLLKTARKRDFQFGLHCSLYEFEQGCKRLMIVDLPKDYTQQACAEFVLAILRLAQLQPQFILEGLEGALCLPLSLESGRGQVLFLLNPSAKAIEGTLRFRERKRVGDLAALDDTEAPRERPSVLKMELAVPKWGVLPIWIEAPTRSEIGVRNDTASL